MTSLTPKGNECWTAQTSALSLVGLFVKAGEGAVEEAAELEQEMSEDECNV